MNDRFEIPARLKNTSLFLIAVGVLALVGGIACLLMGHNSTDVDKSRFGQCCFTIVCFLH